MAGKLGKSAAVARLTALAFQKYAPELHRYVLRRLRRPEDAPDLTQEIFERFMKVDRMDAIENPQGYLFRIASHVVSESLSRDEHSRVTYDSELAQKVAEGFGQESPGQSSPDELADHLNLERDIRAALRTLPDSQLVALLLVKSEGLSYQEAARESGLTANTIGTYVTQARARLKRVLEEYAGKREPRK